jgi:WD40 repeat protein
VSNEGTLVHGGAGLGIFELTGPVALVITDLLGDSRSGADISELSGLPVDRYRSVSVHRDGDLALASIEQVEEDGTILSDVWILDLVRQSRRRITNDGISVSPTWSADGDSIVYVRSLENDQLRVRAAFGMGNDRLLLQPDIHDVADLAISPDGSIMAMSGAFRGMMAAQSLLHLTFPDGPADLSTELETNPRRPDFSPDGKWLAYDDGGRIYIQSLEDLDSSPYVAWETGMTSPKWSADGTKLFAIALDGSPNSIPVSLESGFTVLGPPVTEVAWAAGSGSFDLVDGIGSLLMTYRAPAEDAGEAREDSTRRLHELHFIVGLQNILE